MLSYRDGITDRYTESSGSYSFFGWRLLFGRFCQRWFASTAWILLSFHWVLRRMPVMHADVIYVVVNVRTLGIFVAFP